MTRKADIYTLCMFLVMSQEVLNRYKRGHKLTPKEKYICLGILLRTVESFNTLRSDEKFLSGLHICSTEGTQIKF